MIGSKFSRHFFNQSEVKPKPIVARAGTFSRALCRLRVITWSFDWSSGLSPSFLIGQSNYFGFGFTTLILKPLFPKDFFAIVLSTNMAAVTSDAIKEKQGLIYMVSWHIKSIWQQTRGNFSVVKSITKQLFICNELPLPHPPKKCFARFLQCARAFQHEKERMTI